MIPREAQKAMAEEERFFGIKPGFKQYTPYPFSGMNQKSTSRQDGKDQEFWYLENFIKTGEGCLRTLWDQGSPLYTAPSGKTIIYNFFYNIGTIDYAAIFLNDGTAVQVDMSGNIITISSSANTFYNSSISAQIPACSQWGSEYLLIANNFTVNGYWIWDGSLLYDAGSLSPLVTVVDSGSGYGSAPTVTAFGGSGTGATFTATVSGGSVTNIMITNPGSGYQPNDQVQLYITGGGSDSTAELVAVLSSGTLESVVITNPGSGYTLGTYALGISGGGGTLGAGTYTVDGSNTVVSASIVTPGSGYTGSPTITFPSGGGTGATGFATLNPGSIASVTVVHGGTNFTGTPIITFVGGGGSGATATAVLTAGSISSVTVTNNGTGYTSIPAVVVQSGFNNAAAATVSLMPYGVSGSSIETFQSRIWLPYPYKNGNFQSQGTQNGDIFLVSAPSSVSDFSVSDGGDVFISSDSFLRKQYINIKQNNGYLYTLGDSSVSVISNVQTSGNPSTTTFNYQNTDPQIGAAWRDTVQVYSRTILFANPLGVYGLYGGSVTKVSPQMDNIFNNAVFPFAGGATPSSAVANIYGTKVYLMNMTILDPFTKQQRTVMLGWNEKEWIIVSQASVFTFISTQEISSDLIAWGTDGKSLYPMLNFPSTLITKKISSKLYGQDNFLVQKESMGFYIQTQDLSPAGAGMSLSSVTVDSETGSYAIPFIPSFPASIPPRYVVQSMGSGDVYGVNLGFTLTSNSQDFAISMLSLGYIETGSIAMGNTPLAVGNQTE